MQLTSEIGCGYNYSGKRASQFQLNVTISNGTNAHHIRQTRIEAKVSFLMTNRVKHGWTRQVKDLDFQIVLPGIAAVQPIVKPSPLKPQKSKRSQKTPQPDLVPRRTPRHTTPSAQPITQRPPRRKNGIVLNKKAGKPSSLDPPNGGTQDGAVITLSTNIEEPGTKEREFIPAVANEANHTVGLPLVPEGKHGVPKLDEVAKPPKPGKPQGNKRKKRASTGKYSKKSKLATSRETAGHATPPDVEGLNLVNTGSIEAAVDQASQPIVATHTPEKQTGLPNLTDLLSPTNTAQSPGEVRRRLIAIAQSSLKRLRLEVPDEAQEFEETSIQPYVEAPATITCGSELTVAGGAGDSRNLVQPQSNLPDPTGTVSPIAAAPQEREKSTSIEQHLRKRPKLIHVIEDPEIVAPLSIEGQESAVLQQAPAAEPQGGEVQEEPKSKSPARGFGEEMLSLDETLEISQHEDLTRQDSLQENPLHDDPPHGTPPQEDSPGEGPPHEPSVENDNPNSGAALSKTIPKNKPKRKKRKAIGQQSLRRKAKAAVKPTIRPTALNPAAKPQVTHINDTSKIKFRGKAGSRKLAQILDDNDDDDEDLLSTSNYEPATRLARRLGGKPRAANVEDSIVGRNVGKPRTVNKLATGKGGISSKGSNNDPRNETSFGRAKKVAIRTSQKSQLHSPSRLSKTPTRAKQNSTIKKSQGKSSLKNVPSSLDDDHFWYPQISGSDEPIKPLSRGRGPSQRSPLADELMQEDEDEFKAVDMRASTKIDSFDKGNDETEEELGGIDPIAPAREDFSGQDEYDDELSNDGDAGRISKTAINKSYQRLQSGAANPSKTTKVLRPRPRATTRKPPENCIPITVYRMPSNHDLDPDTDNLNHTNNTVNAVDVLAQVCREQISKSAASASEAANQESNPSEKLTLERKAKAIKMYGDELELQFFHLTQALNTNTSLSTSLRQTRKRESHLRAELSSLQEAKSALVKQITEIKFSRDKSARRRRIYALLGEIQDAVKQGRELDDGDDAGGSTAAGVVKVSALWNLEGGGQIMGSERS